MSKKLGLDAAYKGLNLTTSVNKNSVLNKINLSGSTGMKAYDSTKMLTNSIALGVKKPSQLTFGKKALSIGKKVFKSTAFGKALNLATAGAMGAAVGLETGKKRYKKYIDKKMGGGMMQGYGAARTSGMGLEDESLMPGTIYKAKKGKIIKAGLGSFITKMFGGKRQAAAYTPTGDALTGDKSMLVREELFKKFHNKMGASKGKMIKK